MDMKKFSLVTSLSGITMKFFFEHGTLDLIIPSWHTYWLWICSFHTVGFSIRSRRTCNNGHSFVFVDSTQPMLSLQKVFFLPHMKLCPISISQDSLRWSTWCHQKLIIYCKYVSMFLISWDLHVLDFDLMYKLFINYICMNVW